MADNTDIAFDLQVKGVEQSIESVKDLKNAIKAAKDEQIKAASVFGESSKEFIDASKKVSALKDKVDDLADSTKSLKGSGIERANEGFSQLGEGLKNLDFDKVKVGLTAMKSALAAVGIGLIIQLVSYLIENFDELSQGTGGLAKALRFVGDIIGQIIAVGEKMLNFVTDLIGLTTESERALEAQGNAIVESSNKTKAALAEQVKGFDNQIAAAKAAGKSTVDLEIAKQEAIIETNKKIAEQMIAFVKSGGIMTTEQKKLFDESITAIKTAKATENVITLTAERENTAKLKTLTDERTSANLEAIKAIEDAKIAAIKDEELRAFAKEVLDNERRIKDIAASKASNDLKNQQLEANEVLFQDNLTKINEDGAAKRKAIDDKAAADKATADAKALADRKIVVDAENAEKLAAAELAVVETQSSLQADLDLLLLKKNLAVEAAAGKENEIALIEANYRVAKKDAEDADRAEKAAKEKAERDANFERAQGALNSLQSISDAFFAVKMANVTKGSAAELKAAKKQFDINKGIAIASATISGIQGVINALSAQSVVPEPFGTALKVLTAVGIAASTVANISKISSQKFDAGGGGGASAGGSASVPPIPSPPTISTPENNTNKTTSFDETGKNLNAPTTVTPTIKVTATVGVDEISAKKDRVDVLENQSTFK